MADSWNSFSFYLARLKENLHGNIKAIAHPLTKSSDLFFHCSRFNFISFIYMSSSHTLLLNTFLFSVILIPYK